MVFDTLQFEIKEQVGYLTISRAKALNALNVKVLDEIESFVKTLDTKQIRVLIVQGAGDKAFVAGADIKEMSSLTPEDAKRFSQKGQRVFSLIEDLPFPVIAVIQGFALGGGLELALSCDILIMETKTKIGLPEVSLSLLPAFGGTQRLSRSVGLYRAKEMIFTGDFYTAKEAFEMGLANKVVDKKDLLKTAESMAQTIKSRAPIAISKSKKLIHQSRDFSIDKGLELEAKEFGDLFNYEDSREGIEAFISKRKANFKGL